MVRLSDLEPEDNGSYERALAKQKEECLKFLNAKVGKKDAGPVEVYTSLRQLLMDVERGRIKRLIVHDVNRLGATREDVEGVLFELRSGGIPVLSAQE
jgi:DNA invertase Pin-like site-specific DNA recombinase